MAWLHANSEPWKQQYLPGEMIVSCASLIWASIP